jgi:hypothetical protein
MVGPAEAVRATEDLLFPRREARPSRTGRPVKAAELEEKDRHVPTKHEASPSLSEKLISVNVGFQGPAGCRPLFRVLNEAFEI